MAVTDMQFNWMWARDFDDPHSHSVTIQVPGVAAVCEIAHTAARSSRGSGSRKATSLTGSTPARREAPLGCKGRWRRDFGVSSGGDGTRELLRAFAGVGQFGQFRPAGPIVVSQTSHAPRSDSVPNFHASSQGDAHSIATGQTSMVD
jgi:hypothetical protein